MSDKLRVHKHTQQVGDVQVSTSIVVPITEHEKLSRVATESNAIGQFLDWLQYDREPRIELATWLGSGLVPSGVRIPSLLAEYFEINEQKLEDEKIAMLEAIRR